MMLISKSVACHLCIVYLFLGVGRCLYRAWWRLVSVQQRSTLPCRSVPAYVIFSVSVFRVWSSTFPHWFHY